MKRLTFTLGALLVLSGCATGYHSSGITGGLTETQLSERVYQVRFQGNGYTSQDRTSVFLLRRCAELTLEQGFRYFTLGAQGTGSMESGASGWIMSFPHGTATVKFLQQEGDDPTPLDAVIVVKNTDERAGGRLSEKAQRGLRALNLTPVPVEVPVGAKLSLPSGEYFGEVLSLEPKHRFNDGRVEEAALVRQAKGEKGWLTLDQARGMLPAPSQK